MIIFYVVWVWLLSFSLRFLRFTCDIACVFLSIMFLYVFWTMEIMLDKKQI